MINNISYSDRDKVVGAAATVSPLTRILKPGGVDHQFQYQATAAIADPVAGPDEAKLLVSYQCEKTAYSGPPTTRSYHYDPTGPNGSYTEYQRPLENGNVASSKVYVAKSITHPDHGKVYRQVSEDENGAVTTTISDGRNVLESQTVSADGALFRTSRYRYDAKDNLTHSVTRNAETIPADTWDEVNTFDQYGRVTCTVRADGVAHRVKYLVGDNGGMDTRKEKEWDEAGGVQINRVEYVYYEATDPVHQRYRLKEERRILDASTTYTVTYDYIDATVDPANPQNYGNLWKKTCGDGSFEEWRYGWCGGVLNYWDRSGAHTLYVRNYAGWLLAEHAPSGAVTYYTYDDAGRVLTTTLPAGGIVANTLDAAGRVTRTEYPDGTAEYRSYRADGDGQLESETSRTGLVTSYHYNDTGARPDGALLSVGTADNDEATPDGAVQSTTYDGLGRVKTQTDARGLTLAFEYDQFGNRFKTIWPPALSGVEGDGTFTEQTFNAAGQLLASRDRMARVTEFEYDSFGRQTAVILPNDLRRETVYDDLSRVVETRLIGDNTTLTTSYTLDADGNQTAIAYPDGTVEAFVYEGGLLKSRTDRAGKTWKYTYTDAGQPDQVQILAPDGSATTVSNLDYAPNGQVSAETGPDGVTVAYIYDNLGRRTRVTMPDGTHSDTVYDDPSGPTSQTDRAGFLTAIKYDAYGRRTQVIDPNLQLVAFAYNLAGDLVTLTDANNNPTSWAYDTEGRVIRKTYADNTFYEYSWYPDGKLHTRKDAKGAVTTYTWNSLGLLIGVDYPLDPDVSYAYDTFGRRTGMTDAVGSTSWTYNAAGDILTEDGPFANDTITYGYENGRKASMAFRANQTGYGYDALSRVSGVTASNGAAPAQAFSYSFLGQSNKIAGVALNGSPIVANSFDSLARLTQKSNTFGAATISSYQYQLNDADQRTRVTTADGKYIDYSYDAAGQLESARRHLPNGAQDFSYNYSYSFDPMGNPDTKTINGQTRIYTANNLNQIATATSPDSTDVLGKIAPLLVAPFNVTVNGQPATVDAEGNWLRQGVALTPGENEIAIQATDKYNRTASELRNITLASAPAFTYDLNGNMTSDGRLNYSWNDENRISSVESVSSVANKTKVEFSYDGQGRMRTEKEFSWAPIIGQWNLGSEKHFIYDGTRILAELDGADAEIRFNAWGLDINGGLGTAGGVGGLLAVSDSTGTFFPCFDGNGNITAYVDATGTIAAEIEYAPFGAAKQISGAKSFPFGFSTQYTAHGFVHYFYRTYSPEFDRWLSRDPADNIYGYNIYSFVKNNPVCWWDYLGRELIFEVDDNDLREKIKRLWEKVKDSANDKVKTMINKMENDKRVCKIKIVSNSKAVVIGSYHLESIDIGDISKLPDFGPTTRLSSFLHEVVEQWGKQANKLTFENAHEIATSAEEGITGIKIIKQTDLTFDKSNLVYYFKLIGVLKSTSTDTEGNIKESTNTITQKITIFDGQVIKVDTDEIEDIPLGPPPDPLKGPPIVIPPIKFNR